ncbi:MAG: hypothetical protein HQL05_03515 [Nitrospirae bacterium]|uniref:hypothetical protein n=1 Tax=Candidatus Magnetobacterium casense TaxID=1455061 RepID=UPI0012DC5091|nr:hypothetical protein [Candidatus Magnetobacterium casensis]MBF0336877.1 hypothetical protein [Nitrospirota bacterium]
MSNSRALLHELVEELSEPDTEIAERFITFLITEHSNKSPLVLELLDESELREEFLEAVEEAEREIESCDVKTWEEFKAEIGL